MSSSASNQSEGDSKPVTPGRDASHSPTDSQYNPPPDKIAARLGLISPHLASK